jgi:hypothetical protein
MLAGAAAVDEEVNTDLRTLADHPDRNDPGKNRHRRQRTRMRGRRFRVFQTLPGRYRVRPSQGEGVYYPPFGRGRPPKHQRL